MANSRYDKRAAGTAGAMPIGDVIDLLPEGRLLDPTRESAAERLRRLANIIERDRSAGLEVALNHIQYVIEDLNRLLELEGSGDGE